MSRRGTPALLIPLAAMLALVFPFAFSVRQPGTTDHQESAKVKRAFTQKQRPASVTEEGIKKAPPRHDAERILKDFFGSDTVPQNSCPASGPGGPYCVLFMIATVPDPSASHLPYLFDCFLGSMQRAAEAEHLMLDRFDLPWLEELEKKEASRESSGSATEATPEPVENHDYLTEPGLVLFRDPQSAKGPRLLVVFLVGETPTAGVHKEALLSALRQIDRLSGPNNSTIKILGPAFSGSAESMESTLRDWLAERGQQQNGIAKAHKLEITIVSGSATAAPIASSPSENCRYYFDRNDDKIHMTFQSTVVPDAAASTFFLSICSVTCREKNRFVWGF